MEGFKISGANPRFTIILELSSAVGLLKVDEVLTLMFMVLVIWLLKDPALGGLPLFLLTGVSGDMLKIKVKRTSGLPTGGGGENDAGGSNLSRSLHFVEQGGSRIIVKVLT